MKNLYKILAFAIFNVFFFVNIYTLKDGHNWGDDFAQYIRHAINLVEHKPYTANISLDYWIVSPPGFPFLLSSLIYWFGVNLKILKLLNVVIWGLSALVVYSLVLMRLNLVWARVLTVWFLTCPFLFTFKQNVLSDIPFMCFILMSIWSFMKFEEYQQKDLNVSSRVFLVLSILCMSYALLIRWAGFSLFLAVIVYLLIVKRRWNLSLGFILGALVSWFIAIQCGCLVSGYFYKVTQSTQEWFGFCWYNITYNFQMILSFFVADDKLFSQILTPVTFNLINSIFALLFLGIITIFIYRLIHRKISFMGCVTFFYLMGAFLWPVSGGERYVLPVMVPLTICGIRYIKANFHKILALIFVILIFMNIFIIVSNLKFNNDDIYQKESLEMIQWVGRNIKPDERYMFSHPRALSLFTNHIGALFFVYPEDKNRWYKRIKPLQIKFLITDKQYDYISRYKDFIVPVADYKLHVNEVWENCRYKIFKVS